MTKHVISLFDYTGNMLVPWRDAGYECWAVDVQHPAASSDEPHTKDGIHLVHANLRMPWLPPLDRSDIAFVAAFPPCDHLAVSGARWFRGKGLRTLSGSIDLFATAAEFCEWAGAPYMIENPVSTISSYWRKPDHRFHPHEYAALEETDNYTKQTCLWTGHGFVMPERQPAPHLGAPDDRIHKCPPSSERANIRSATPMGFARAVFDANHRGPSWSTDNDTPCSGETTPIARSA